MATKINHGSAGVPCPKCGHEISWVVDSRRVNASPAVRRRRECIACKARYTTYEQITVPLIHLAAQAATVDRYLGALVKQVGALQAMIENAKGEDE